MTTIADITAADHADMLGAIRSLPSQFRVGRDAAAIRREAIAARTASSPGALVVCGMGGSGVGADLLPAVFDTDVPVVGVKGYDLPSWVNEQDMVVCVSYSGNTAETLSCFAQANDSHHVTAAVITSGGKLAELAQQAEVPWVEVPGGLQPRAATGVLFGALATVASACGAVGGSDHVDDVLDECAKGVQTVVDQHPVDVDPTTLPGLVAARDLAGCVVVIYGAGATAPVAWRWKAQVNENGKLPAFANSYPELDHNEIVGWTRFAETGAKVGVVELLPPDASEAVRARFDITKDLIGESASVVLRYEATSQSKPAALFELLAHGDFVSAYLALDAGIDPSPVDRIESLKERLGGR